MNSQAIVDDPHLPSISLVDETDPSSQLYASSSPFNNQQHSPSPSHSASPIDIPYHPSNEYGYQPSPSPSAHQFGFGGAVPGTPSYQGSPYGSRHNSPLGDAHSWAGDLEPLDLDPLDGTGAQLHMFDNDGGEEYNPSEYDVPEGTTLYSNPTANPADLSPYELMADEFDFSSPPPPNVSVVPAETFSRKEQPMQDTSPASSAGLENPRSPSPAHILSQPQQRPRSRASSIASSHGSPNSHVGDTFQQQTPGFEPKWGSVTAPSPPPNGGSRSPPALLIPDTTQQNHLTPGGLFPPEMAGQPRLGITGVGDSEGPGINLIPATPVSGGGNGVMAGIPFGGHFGQPRASDVSHPTSQRPPSPLNNVSGAPAGSRTATTPPPPRTPPPLPLPPMSVPSNAGSPHTSPQPTNVGNPVDVHMWVPQPSEQQAAMNMANSHGGGAGSNPPSPFLGHRHSPSPVPSNAMLGAGTAPTAPAAGHSLGVPYLKRERSKSDTFSNQQRPAWALGVGTWNQATPPPSSNPMATMTAETPFMPLPSSADAYHPTFGHHSPHHSPQLLPQHNSFPPMQHQPQYMSQDLYLSPDQMNSMRRSRSDAGGHRRGAKSEDFSQSSPGLDVSFSGGLLAPPTNSHPSLMVPGDQYGRGRSPMGGMNMGMNGGLTHHRRASSGSRAGSVSGGSSVRASPYPSPNASPMVGYAQLGPDVGTVPMSTLSIGGVPPTQQQQMIQVARPHVTTSATQAASQTRRTSEATFTCPVPGCGSTFTRHFNLKGHMRSHNDERPFKCKWPGCEKGFARQHDCKRHEQLHLNIRPYTCEGCSRTFARMDALNRHLRSEGGAECAKHQQPLTEEKAPTKQEDPAWRPGAVLT